jgi:protein-tyrosine-phosphatase
LTFILKHPVAMALKRPVKAACWAARGRGLVNPAVPPSVSSMLFVCKGNICRSPFAAARAAQLLRESKVEDVRCLSAGLRTTQAARPPCEACAAASRFALSLEDHVPLQLTGEMMRAHDVVFVMEADQFLTLRREYPEASARVFLLPLLDRSAEDGHARYNIVDPFGQPAESFDLCYQRIDTILRTSLPRFVPCPTDR